jgi:hypothetical protein
MKWMKTDFPTQKNSHKKKGAVATMTAEKCHPKALSAFRWSGGSVGESNPEGRMIKSIVSSQINNQESFGVFLECDRQPFCNREELAQFKVPIHPFRSANMMVSYYNQKFQEIKAD